MGELYNPLKDIPPSRNQQFGEASPQESRLKFLHGIIFQAQEESVSFPFLPRVENCTGDVSRVAVQPQSDINSKASSFH
jgi:hypothetical protein